MTNLEELRARKNQDFDGCATLDNEELDALLDVVEAAERLVASPGAQYADTATIAAKQGALAALAKLEGKP